MNQDNDDLHRHEGPSAVPVILDLSLACHEPLTIQLASSWPSRVRIIFFDIRRFNEPRSSTSAVENA
ncbi:MAG TPA: hypothetical protein VFK31_01970 [Rhodanobacteraceae bacterium]|nr:hypothetical protein [Rhodanobacteraceae bacterium]